MTVQSRTNIHLKVDLAVSEYLVKYMINNKSRIIVNFRFV